MASLMLVNPAKRKSKTRKKARRPSVAKRASVAVSRVTKRVKRYRRNPISGGGVNIKSQLTAAVIGAGGALAVDVAMAKIPFLAGQTGNMRTAAQGAVALGLGMAVAKFGKNKQLGVQLATGGLTVALHSLGKNALKTTVPTLNLAGDGLLGYEELGESLLGYDYLDNDGGVGWLSPAPISDGFDDY